MGVKRQSMGDNDLSKSIQKNEKKQKIQKNKKEKSKKTKKTEKLKKEKKEKKEIEEDLKNAEQLLLSLKQPSQMTSEENINEVKREIQRLKKELKKKSEGDSDDDSDDYSDEETKKLAEDEFAGIKFVGNSCPWSNAQAYDSADDEDSEEDEGPEFVNRVEVATNLNFENVENVMVGQEGRDILAGGPEGSAEGDPKDLKPGFKFVTVLLQYQKCFLVVGYVYPVAKEYAANRLTDWVFVNSAFDEVQFRIDGM